ncbi:hypothetical protein M427DRAFT_469452 [Gonapodya prolifera JEL478]|uniref:GATA-type domain-containing protein n=1 Tax=Gonapodya prolifera (strain JEL478) TaxID=1344416 RepID=A0A139ARI5_GONPJ|nr:hypothetical protein M427DRAFT_469452 [Gonapodya prolifera JEL478]|eukprot:KXS19133.1 hypothetical protein M427DRAFT_469452 [Gonapodya prolifera JEL478]
MTFITALNRNSNAFAVAINYNEELRSRLRVILLVLEQDCERSVKELAKWMLDELALRENQTGGQPDNRQFIIVQADWPGNTMPPAATSSPSFQQPAPMMMGVPSFGYNASPPQWYPTDYFTEQQPSSFGHPVHNAPSDSAPKKFCHECGTQSSPEWRSGPGGTKLCNACGLRFRRRNQVNGQKQRRESNGRRP